MNGKPVAQMTRHEILDALLEDGFDIDAADAAEVSKTIQQASRSGALLWGATSIVSTLRARPLRLNKAVERISEND